MATANAIAAQPAPALTKRRSWSWLFGYLLIAPPVLIMLLLIFYPAAQAVFETLFVVDPQTGQLTITLQNYIAFFQDPVLFANLVFTVWITLASVALLFVVGYPLAMYLRFSKSRFAGTVQVLTLFPLFVPGVILAFALIRFLGTHGMFDTFLGVFGITGYRTP